MDRCENGREVCRFATKDFDGMYAAFADEVKFFIFHPSSKPTIRGAEAVRALEVATLAGCEPGRRDPLFIALHGSGDNLAQFRPRWTSPRLREEFIVAEYSVDLSRVLLGGSFPGGYGTLVTLLGRVPAARR